MMGPFIKQGMAEFNKSIKPMLDKKMDDVKKDVKDNVASLKRDFSEKIDTLDRKLDEIKDAIKRLELAINRNR